MKPGRISPPSARQAWPGRAVPDGRHPHQLAAGLSRLLDRHPPARDVLRHLACVEQALMASAAPEVLPPRLLAAALAQLERLAAGGAHAELAELRLRLASACAVPMLSLADAWEPPDTPSPLERVDAGYAPGSSTSGATKR